MKQNLFTRVFLSVCRLTGLFFIFHFSCSDDVGDRYATYEAEQIMSFLDKNPDMYSEFSAVLHASGISDLLNAYGNYTCFAPTNDALRKYYEREKKSFKDLTEEDIKELAFSHILKKEFISLNFPDGAIGTANMAERYLYISYGVEGTTPVVYVNDNSRILILDQEMHNGVIHTIDAILEVSRVQLPEFIAVDSRFSLFSEALYATGLADSLRMVKDENYESMEVVSKIYITEIWKTPPFLKYGYTALMESDATFASYGIDDLDNLKVYAASIYDEMYPEDRNISNPTDRRNSLNRFVSYHLLDRMLASNDFITEDMRSYVVPGTVLYEYLETMCPNTLMEVQTGNLINKRKDGSCVNFLTTNHQTENGIYHEIDKILVYDRSVEEDVLNKRIRIDVISMLPELATNKVRGDYTMYIIPPGYLKYLSFSEGTQPHAKINRGYRNWLGDEILLGGKYDFTLRTPPIPSGTYEVRLGFVANTNRGVAQAYFDGIPCGIPLDMRIQGTHPQIGWIADANTFDNGIENDKMMHNRGYMKGPNTNYILGNSMLARDNEQPLRRILTIKTFDKTEPHTLRVKCVEDRPREYHLDYLEFVPLSYLEHEGRD